MTTVASVPSASPSVALPVAPLRPRLLMSSNLTPAKPETNPPPPPPPIDCGDHVDASSPSSTSVSPSPSPSGESEAIASRLRPRSRTMFPISVGDFDYSTLNGETGDSSTSMTPPPVTTSRKRKFPSSSNDDENEDDSDDLSVMVLDDDGDHTPMSATSADSDEGDACTSDDDEETQTSSSGRATRKLHRFSRHQRERLEMVLTQANMYPNKHWNLVDASLHVPSSSASASATTTPTKLTQRQSRAAERRIVDNLTRTLDMERKNICNWFQNKRSATRKFLKKIGCDADRFMQKCRDTHDRRIDHSMLMQLCQKVNFASQEAAPPSAQVREEICVLLAAHDMYWPRKGWKPPTSAASAKRRRLNQSASTSKKPASVSTSSTPTSCQPRTASSVSTPAASPGSTSPTTAPVSPSRRPIGADPFHSPSSMGMPLLLPSSVSASSGGSASPMSVVDDLSPMSGVGGDLSPLAASTCQSPQFPAARVLPSSSPVSMTSSSPHSVHQLHPAPALAAAAAPLHLQQSVVGGVTAAAALTAATALRKAQLEAAVRHIKGLLAARLLLAQHQALAAAANGLSSSLAAASAAAASASLNVSPSVDLPPLPTMSAHNDIPEDLKMFAGLDLAVSGNTPTSHSPCLPKDENFAAASHAASPFMSFGPMLQISDSALDSPFGALPLTPKHVLPNTSCELVGALPPATAIDMDPLMSMSSGELGTHSMSAISVDFAT